MFGALGGVLPLRLGGSDTNGLTAAQHARIAADLVATFRTTPIAVWSYSKSGSSVDITGYRGTNGVGLAHAPTATVNGTGDVTFTWPDDDSPAMAIYEDELGEPMSFTDIVAASAGAMINSPESGAMVTVTPNSVRVFTNNFGSGFGPFDTSATVEVWGGPRLTSVAIGDYGGDLEKEDSDTEGRAPYAAHILAELQEQRGTAYTTTPGRLVDVENLALARFLAATGPRTAEKLRANATPARSDERLPYWQKFLAVPTKPGEPKWRLRQKLAAHYRASEGATRGAVVAALEELLGDAFVDATWDEGATLSAPPFPTYWPGVNPGPDDGLGGGTWLSTRCHLFVEVAIPAGMTTGEFLTLVNVDMQTTLDRMLPAWATFDWALGSDGFLVSGSETDPDGGLVDFTGL
jgi:hypothetical protein